MVLLLLATFAEGLSGRVAAGGATTVPDRYLIGVPKASGPWAESSVGIKESVVRIYGGQYTNSGNCNRRRGSRLRRLNRYPPACPVVVHVRCYPEACGDSIGTTGLPGWSFMFVATKERRQF